MLDRLTVDRVLGLNLPIFPLLLIMIGANLLFRPLIERARRE